MIPLELNKDINPNLIYDDICKKYTLNRLNGVLKINTEIPENGQYMINMKYNSIDNPNLRLQVNGVLLDNNFCKTKTGSLDYIISINYKNGPYNLKKGNTLIEILCFGRFPEVYELYIEKYAPLPIQIYQYKPADFLIIRNYNVYGGFYWNLNNIIVGLMACDAYGKIPVICMDTGFYMNNTDLEGTMIRYCPNWYSYYFEDPVKIPASLYGYLVSTKKKIPCTPLTIKSQQNPNFIYAFNRNTFNRFSRLNKYKETCQKYIKIHPNIEKYIDHIKSQVFTQEGENLKYIGVHYRGTDKIAEKNSNEEYPIHYEYNQIYEILNKKKSKLEGKGNDVYIVVTTDEQPFIDYLVERMGDRVLYYKEGLRSNANTSGLTENFEKIESRSKKIDTSNLDEKEQKTYNLRDNLVNSSLHIGHKTESNYKKGLECLIDAKLLDRCDIYYKSKGNFSLFCYYFNTNENLQVYDLNDLVKGNITD